MSLALKNSAHLAVLIDADNTPHSEIPSIMNEIVKLGTSSVRRIYGDWSSQSLSNWKGVLLDHSIQAVQQFSYTKGKNATDIAMVIDAMDLMHTGRFDGFCIVSSDSDFTPLASRLREQSLTVYGFGQQKTPKAFVESCDKFIYLELLASNTDSSSAKKPTTDPKLYDYFRNAIEATSDESGWASLGGVGSHLNKQAPDFDSRSWGHSKLSDLAAEIPNIETKHANSQFKVRLKPTKKRAAAVRKNSSPAKKTAKKSAKKKGQTNSQNKPPIAPNQIRIDNPPGIITLPPAVGSKPKG